MSTWSAEIALDKEFQHYTVLCTGERESETCIRDDIVHHSFHHHSFILPLSTFAIAIGNWTVRRIDNEHPRVRFIGSRDQVEDKFEGVSRYVPLCLEVAQKVLGIVMLVILISILSS